MNYKATTSNNKLKIYEFTRLKSFQVVLLQSFNESFPRDYFVVLFLKKLNKKYSDIIVHKMREIEWKRAATRGFHV